MTYTRPEPLRGKHSLDAFSSGEPNMDNWLQRRARHAEAAGSARTFVTTDRAQVVGYYSLAIGQVLPEDASERLLKGQPATRPVPVLVLARLAVDQRHQGRGVGRSLLQDALLRCNAVAESVGVRALVAHALPGAGGFYDNFGFDRSPTDSLHRILLLKDLRRFLAAVEAD
ncbi:MAG TPA: GNAT family N-acetyltransferase [Solirubrobacterales bacterium]|nr:GNAT family N-acetyltransferase [Solirubrobacterales bacterium]